MDITEICAAIRKAGPLAPEAARQLVATVTTGFTDWLGHERVKTAASEDATEALAGAFETLDHLHDTLNPVDSDALFAELACDDARDRANFARATGAAAALRGMAS